MKNKNIQNIRKMNSYTGIGNKSTTVYTHVNYNVYTFEIMGEWLIFR